MIASWLLDLTAAALADEPELKSFAGHVSDSGEGRWTIPAAIDEGVPAHVLTRRALSTLQLARRGRFRGPAALSDALPVRRPSRERSRRGNSAEAGSVMTGPSATRDVHEQVRLVVADVDGTLVTPDKILTPRARAVVRQSSRRESPSRSPAAGLHWA